MSTKTKRPGGRSMNASNKAMSDMSGVTSLPKGGGRKTRMQGFDNKVSKGSKAAK